MKKFSFSAVIESGEGGGAWIRVPIDTEKEFGRKRVKILASIDGRPYRGSLAWIGSRGPILGVLKEIRAAIGKEIGDKVTVVFWEDLEPRTVEIPADLKSEFRRHHGTSAAFEKLSYTLRKEYVLSIESAKRVETRQGRVAKVVQKLTQG